MTWSPILSDIFFHFIDIFIQETINIIRKINRILFYDSIIIDTKSVDIDNIFCGDNNINDLVLNVLTWESWGKSITSLATRPMWKNTKHSGVKEHENILAKEACEDWEIHNSILMKRLCKYNWKVWISTIWKC